MERRNFLKSTGAVAATIGTTALLDFPLLEQKARAAGWSDGPSKATAGSHRAGSPLTTLSSDLTPYTGSWSDAQVRHLLRRTMFGVPIAQMTAALAMNSMSDLVQTLLDTSKADTSLAGNWVNEFVQPDSSLTDPKAIDIDTHNVANKEAARMRQTKNWWLSLMLKSNLSAVEKMAFMWSNHFVVGTNVISHAGYLAQYIQTLRTYALGNLKQFVLAIATDPAMLQYLNGNQNYYGEDPNGNAVGNHVNENFGREVMELFTLGLTDPKTGAANYTQDDVEAAARAFSGWQPTTTAPFKGVLLPQCFDSSAKTFLGLTGNFGLNEIIDLIFQKDGGYTVAYWVCQKIYMNFVYSIPNASVVDTMANLLVQSNWEIKPVMTALLSSAHFYDTNVIGAQFKSPMEWMCGIVREFELDYFAYAGDDPGVSGTDASGYHTFYDTNVALTFLVETVGVDLGQELLNPPNVKGWPIGPDWITTKYFQNRQEHAAKLLAYPVYYNRSPDVNGVYLDFEADVWMKSWPDAGTILITPLAKEIEAHMLGVPPGPIETDALYHIVNALQVPDQQFNFSKDYGAGFARAMAQLPEFQLT